MSNSDDRLLRLLAVSTVLVAPLPFGCVGPRAVFFLQCAALLAASTLAWRISCGGGAPRELRAPLWAGGLIVTIGVVQLLPLPIAWTRQLAGPTFHARSTLSEIIEPFAHSFAPLSAAPPDTITAVLRLIMVGAFGVAVASSFKTRRQLRLLVVTLIAAGCFQALYGAFEYLSGRQQIFGFVKRYYLDEATGTFINRNHFAGFLAMTLPFALSLLPATGAEPGADRYRWRERVVAAFQPSGLRSLLGLLAVGSITLGLLLSFSRGGLVAAAVGGLACLRHLGSRRLRGGIVIVALLLPLALWNFQEVRDPGERWLEVTDDAHAGTGRIAVWKATLELIRDYPWFGSGLGTFGAVLPAYQPAEVRLFWDHAHNDWLQAWAEGGPLVFASAVALLVMMWVRAGQVIRLRSADLARVAVSARAALLALAVHSLVDFQLRIPANAVVAGVIFGLLFCRGLSAADEDDEKPTAALYPFVPTKD